MTGLTTDILLVMLKSQLKIKEAIQTRIYKEGTPSYTFGLLLVTKVEIREIRSQILMIENENAEQKS